VSGNEVSSEIFIRPKPADNEAEFKCTASSLALVEPYSTFFKLKVYCEHIFVTNFITKHYKCNNIKLLNYVCKCDSMLSK